MNSLGNRFFGTSAGSLASVAPAGMPATTGGASCGSAPATSSTSLCGLTGRMVPTVNSQPYTPSSQDGVTVTCKATHG